MLLLMRVLVIIGLVDVGVDCSLCWFLFGFVAVFIDADCY